MNGVEIKWAKTAKYLGVLFDRRITWGPHIRATRDKARAMRASLQPLINRKSKLSSKQKLSLYKACIRPVLTYAFTAWGYATTTE